VKNLFARIGPGMMLAAVAVGVSHLVQSTRAGADYGLSFIWLIVVIVILKYPAFRFAVDYSSATGRSLVTGYSNVSKFALAWLGVAFFVDMFIASGAVSLVTAGLFISVFKLPFSGPVVAVAIMVVSAAILLNGHYAKAERIVKVFVLVFSLLAVAAMLFAMPLLGSDGRDLFAQLTPSRSLAIFVIAVAGWMPMPMTGSIFHSMWVCERRRGGDTEFDYKRSLSDLRIGYGLALVLAICFLVMGTAVLFQTDRVAPANAGAFATELLSIFTTVIGNWSYPIIAAAAIAVMWSTQIALLDALPRVSDRLFGIMTGRADGQPGRYTRFLILQVVGVSIILLFLMSGFGTFIDFATSTGFLAGPALAYYNYRAVTLPEVGAEFRPDKKLIIWSWLSIVSLTLFAVVYIYLRVT
jgi:Mn2+/Fe2+ NRAMP family transporter